MSGLRWRSRRLLIPGLLLLACGLAVGQHFWSKWTPADDGKVFNTSVPTVSQASPLDWEDCPYRLPDGIQARCGWFETGAFTGADEPVRLPMLLLRRDAEPAHAPLTVHLPGGPGAAGGTDADSAWLWAAWMLSNRFPGRLLVFDPRGTGRADPALSCPGREQQVAAMFARAQSAEEEARASRAMLSECRQRLLAAGHEPEQFAAHHMVMDVPGMMSAMGAHRARLMGLSHGSRIALALLREYPSRFSAAVLDGVFPPEQDPLGTLPLVYRQSLERLFARCQDEPACHELALEARYDALFEQLSQIPEPVHFLGPGGRQSLIWLDGRRFSDVVFAAQAYTESMAALPSALVAADKGSFRPLGRILDQVLLAALNPERNDPVYWASICAEARPVDESRLARAVRDADMQDRLSPELWAYHPCTNGWGGDGLPAAFRKPVTVDHPVLLLAGELDPVTPAAWAKEQHARLSAGHLLLARGHTHGLIFSVDCISDAAMEFLRDPSRSDLPSECAGRGSVFQLDN